MSKDNSQDVNKDTNNESNLVKSPINDQIETDNDVIEEVVLSKRDQFLSLFGVNIGEEFYIKSEKERGSYLIYHFNADLSLLARSSNDKEGIMNWFSPALGKLLNDDVEIIKL